jgi:hypothetical protein
MERGLGLDVGANSIGWAVIESNGTDGRILGCGVYVFPEGVENLGQGEKEKSLNATRRSARQRRRQLYHRKLRKRALLKLMGDVGLCPSLSPEELRTWQNTGTFPERPEFLQWLKLNPYLLRQRATTDLLSTQPPARLSTKLRCRQSATQIDDTCNNFFIARFYVTNFNPTECHIFATGKIRIPEIAKVGITLNIIGIIIIAIYFAFLF